MEKRTKENIEGMVKLMKDKELEKEVDTINMEEPLFSLKNSIYDFFKKRLNIISKESDFREIVKAKILEKINEDEYSPAQLINLYKDIINAENSSIYALLDVFKPTKEGAISPLASEVSSSGIGNKISSDISPEDSEALNMITAVIKNAIAKEKEEEK